MTVCAYRSWGPSAFSRAKAAGCLRRNSSCLPYATYRSLQTVARELMTSYAHLHLRSESTASRLRLHVPSMWRI